MLAEFIVNLARDAGAFLFANVLQINREGAQLLVGFAQLLLRATAFVAFLGLSQRTMDGWHEPGERCSAHNPSRRSERFDGHFSPIVR